MKPPAPELCCEVCAKCREALIAQGFRRYHAERAKRTRDRRRGEGLCAKCNLPAVEGMTLCPKHRKIACAARRRAAKAAIVARKLLESQTLGEGI